VARQVAANSADSQESNFVGRVDELASLVSCADLARSGKAQVVWIEGEAGCGKTGLVRRFFSLLPKDLQVLQAEADELAQDVSLEVAGQLGDFSSTDGFGVGMEILSIIDAAENDGPVALLVEDLHWADLASRQALLTAARRLRHDKSMLVMTSRPVFRDDGWDRFTSDPERCVRINLGALSTEEVAELARSCGKPLSRQNADRLHEHTLGHVLYVRTLLSELSITQLSASDGALPAPRSLASTTVGRLAGTTPDAQLLGSAMAVLNRRLPLQLVADVAGLPEPITALEALLDTGLAEWAPAAVGTPIEYAHPLYRAAIYDELSPTLRRDLHVAASSVLEPEEALVHRVAASDPHDHELVGDLVTEARTKKDQRDLGLSAKYWLWSSELSRVPEDKELFLLQGAQCLLADAQVHRAQALQDQIESTRTSPLRSLLLGIIAWTGGDARRAEHRFNEVLTQATTDPSDDSLRAEALVRLASLFVIENRAEDAVQAVKTVLELHPENSSLEVRAWSELARAEGQLRGAPAGLSLLAKRLVADGFRVEASEVDLLLTRGILGFYAGRNVSATADLRNVLRLVRQGAHTAELPRTHLQLAQLLIIGGEWTEAVLHARLGLSLVDDGGQVWIEAQAHAAFGSVMASRGQWSAATAHAKSARSVADIVGSMEAIFTAHIVEGAVARARGDSAGVVASLGPLVGSGESKTMSMISSLGWWPVLVHALIDQNDVETARRQLAQLRIAASDRALDLEARLEGLQARITLLSGDPNKAEDQFAGSLDLFGPDDAILDRAAVHHYFGRLLQARGKRQKAVVQLQCALDLYGGVGADPYIRRVQEDLNTSGIQGRAPKFGAPIPLTEREQDVAALVSKGMTNREVAAELYVSTKAVEYHLRNIYGKLSVTSRNELRAALTN
jgi:DNA-binding CsgD family transcriptional regulator